MCKYIYLTDLKINILPTLKPLGGIITRTETRGKDTFWDFLIIGAFTGYEIYRQYIQHSHQ